MIHSGDTPFWLETLDMHAYMAMTQSCATRGTHIMQNRLCSTWCERVAQLLVLTELTLHSFLVVFLWLKSRTGGGGEET